ncbi:origin recognition complex subunit 4 C-terminus-domain-containing protein [Macrophomina phaseolina]|uniref:Origin recognition complex subunit 4 n=1 Tax=Macrophomina phaseolina TaxID=35725 RepID=A0ABQ8GGR3_9PEZI|nr:origin recognition complex subunit 4 C-terminus-domain-containing protein [Macrophomina phaseolina]
MAPSVRSAKRRKLSPSENNASPAAAENSTPDPTSAKSTLKRATRRAGLASTGTPRASSRLAGRRGLADDLDDPDVYDDIDGAFGGSPARQLQSDAVSAATRIKKPAEPKKTPRAKPRAAKQSDSQKENIPEDSIESAVEQLPAPKSARRARDTRVQDKTAAAEARHGVEEKAISTPARSRGGRAKEEDKEEPDEKTESAKKPGAKARAPAKPRTPATKPTQEKASLLDLVRSGDNSNEESAWDATPELVVSPVAKRRGQPHKAKSTRNDTKSTVSDGGHPSTDALTLLKARVLGQISGKESVPLVGLDDEYTKVHQLVEQTVTAGEGNSMLIIGARGSGKTALVNQVLKELSKDQRQDFHIIRLNGFIHTDDKLALREIWRQLGKEMEVEEDTIGKNYADTLSTLLALLSHPSELAGEESDEVAKAVIFIMDEFDLFASHPRQTLLYNLFDIAQSRKAPITVLGLTTRIGVSENLEKRVKSRFSHRYVHLSLAKSFTSFQEMCKSVLTLRPEELSDSARAALSAQSLPKARSGPKSKEARYSRDLLTSWNDSIAALFSNPIFLQTHLAPHYHLQKSVPGALSTFHLPISLLSPQTFPLTPAHFTTSGPSPNTVLLAPPDSKLTLLPHLSDLALALLVAAARLDIIHDADTCNFNMAYAEYASLASRAKIASAAVGALASGTRVWGREAARREWENLIRWELVMPVVGGGGSGGGIGGGSADSAMVRCDVALEEIAPSVGRSLEKVVERWCKQI